MGVTNVNAVEYPVPQPVVGRGALFVEHRLKTPQVSESAYIAPTAVLAGDVTVGPHSRVLFGAVITAEGGPVEIGRNCVVMEHAVVRAGHALGGRCQEAEARLAPPLRPGAGPASPRSHSPRRAPPARPGGRALARRARAHAAPAGPSSSLACRR